MSTLIHWTPFREMEALQNRLGSIFGLAPSRRHVNGNAESKIPDWAPLVDITEDEKEFVIKAELPDLRREDVAIKVEDGVLTVSGERKFEKEEKGKKYHRVERAYGSFVRSFALPEEADPERITAQFKDGILSVHLAKNEKAQRKTIEVKVA